MQGNTDLSTRVSMLRERFAARDRRAAAVHAVRNGDFDKLSPNAFNENYPRPIVANLIDVYAKHAAAALSPLPTMRCTSGSMGTDAAKNRADRRTKIANHYVRVSRLRDQMQMGADQFYTFGMLVTDTTPDFENKMPDVLVRDSLHYYPVWDAKGRTVECAHVFRMRVVELQAQYPELAAVLGRGGSFRPGAGNEVEVVKHDDGQWITMFVPERSGAVLQRVKNPIGRCMTIATRKPSVDGEIHGAFDDLVWVQIARHEMQMLTMEAAADAVEAPYILPTDVADVPLGPKAIIRTNNPQGAGRLTNNVPQAAFAAIDHFKSEMQSGAITPEALGGSIDASVVTGRGVQELMAGYSQQVAMCQETLTGHFEQLISMCFELDEKLWPDVEKEITGHNAGAPYSLKYTPGKDIKGDFSVDVNYGTSTGLDPNRHLVYLLQQQGAGVISLDTLRRELPGNLDAGEEEAKIQSEQARSSVMQMVAGLAQSIPGMIAQGQDPSKTVSQIAEFVKRLQKGDQVEAIAADVFAPPPPPPETPVGEPGAEGGADPLAALLGGGGPEGATAPGGGAPPAEAGAPDLQNLFAGLSSSGAPNLGSYISRQRPVG